MNGGNTVNRQGVPKRIEIQALQLHHGSTNKKYTEDNALTDKPLSERPKRRKQKEPVEEDIYELQKSKTSHRVKKKRIQNDVLRQKTSTTANS